MVDAGDLSQPLQQHARQRRTRSHAAAQHRRRGLPPPRDPRHAAATTRPAGCSVRHAHHRADRHRDADDCARRGLRAARRRVHHP